MPEKVTKEEKVVELAIEKAKEVIKELRNEQQIIVDDEGKLKDNSETIAEKDMMEEIEVKRPTKNPKEETLDNPAGGESKEYKV
tara:strand:- start:298 stop:549 length:252 start_codon:yes stop_codon:yes gene_type:complete